VNRDAPLHIARYRGKRTKLLVAAVPRVDRERLKKHRELARAVVAVRTCPACPL